MSNPLKKLASQTAIYGLPSIVGRLLNWFLVPMYLGIAAFTTDQYGIVTKMYSYVAFLVVFLTYGMETAFFRFSSQEEHDKKKVYFCIAHKNLVSIMLLKLNLVIAQIARYVFDFRAADWDEITI